MPVRCYKVVVSLFHHEAAFIGAEGSDEVVVSMGVDMELWVTVDAGDRIHYQGRNFHSHSNVDAGVVRLYPVLSHDLLNPCGSDAPWCDEDVGGIDRSSVFKYHTPADTIFDEQSLGKGLEEEFNALLG